VTDVASEAPPAISDDDILQRFLRTKNQPTGSQTLGFRMVSVSQEKMEVEVAFDALDECMSVACMVASKMTAVAPTAEMKTSFFRPVMPGPLKGIGRVLRWGRTLAFTEGELSDGAGRLTATPPGTAGPTPFKNYK
jgi:hypothetical protein